jgi:hypothetical protein
MAVKKDKAIVFMADGSNPRKYTINTDILDFRKFAERIQANYFNVYCGSTAKFKQRVYIKKGT